ncbi:CerR family C-terminal domain-containing protein [Bosea sp. LjRoot90]|uniref:CerR family C-terminal domain-containing protein n=1 Tax=Bosea sp. LjRoot90 TaxID=3342342 RepID=UPI003ECC1FA8
MARTSILKDAEGTRQALIRAGLDLFGRNGFDATSTREIAQVAKVNSAGIAYHFGGKDGLRKACAEAIIARMQAVLMGGAPAASIAADAIDRDAAAEQLLSLIERMIAFLTTAPESEMIARFVVREMFTPSPAFDTIYGGLFEPVHRRVCQVWAAATGMAPEAPETRLAVFAAIGQLVYFRIARPAVTRRMGWDGIGPDQARAIAETIRRSVRASILACRGEAS